MRTALVLLTVTLCASGVMAQPSPADTVPLDHWAYDAIALIGDALGDARPELFRPDHELTRYEFAMVALRALPLLRDGDITAEQAETGHLGEVWRRLASEFLPELSDLCEDIMYLRRDHYDGTPPLPDPPVDSALGDMATTMLHQLPGDHWLYPEVQRVLWAAPGLKRTALTPVDRNQADPLPPEHWAYQAMLRVAPLALRVEREALAGRSVNRWEFAIVASSLFGKLSRAEEPVQHPEAVEVTWALLALEFWPELQDMEATDAVRRVGEEHWLHATAQRVIAIAESSGRQNP